MIFFLSYVNILTVNYLCVECFEYSELMKKFKKEKTSWTELTGLTTGSKVRKRDTNVSFSLCRGRVNISVTLEYLKNYGLIFYLSDCT